MLESKHISMHFGGLAALNDVSLTVRKGEIRGLIGPNGSGKSTFINVITGFYVPTKGEVLFNGQVISGKVPNSIAKHGLCRTFQNINLFAGMSVLENVLTATSVSQTTNLASAMFRTPSFKKQEKECLEKAQNLLEFVGLSKEQDMIAVNLPYGKQRILEIARALATEPQLLMLDEPVAGMNDTESDEAATLVRKLRDDGKTILLVEHHMKFVMNLCDRITVFDSGSIITEGLPEEVRNNPQVIECYLGKKGGK